ncbi:MAG TPA: enoyl-CoA hydratase/isomerase family protein [Chthoniobacterales bacterium]|nr:enoyl-CoA hydratase/isomerase family protein [Chthoniobacterales bacterium]
MTDSTKIQISPEVPVARITLHRPEKLNALDPEMLTALEAGLSLLEGRRDIRVIILQATGEKAFCVGADINAWTALTPLQMWSEWIRHGHRVFSRLLQLRQPVICAIQGLAFGGGLELALACDVRIASESARFAMPEVKLGTVPGWGGTARLPELIGTGRARQMILSGEPVNAAVAEHWGLLNEVVSGDRLIARVEELANRIAANAPIAVQTAKQLVAGGNMVTLESIAAATNAFTQDAAEGLAAFREKRNPSFQGL